MYSGVSFEIERVIKAFPTERAQIPFGVAVTFKMAVQQTL